MMRRPEELFALFEKIAVEDQRIRAMTLEGSRVNPNVTPDRWQDYDITFLVTDVDSFRQSDQWLDIFGDKIFMQKPEAMELFPPDFPNGWFSYLMLFSDGVKIDLTLVPVSDARDYFEQDPLIQVLLDKDQICPGNLRPTDEAFWIQKPSETFVHDCANEFLFVSTYVAKGLLRGELLFANWHFEQILRKELHRMLGYLAGVKKGFPLNTGKHDKWLLPFLSESQRTQLLGTYRLDSMESAWNALYAAMDLFEEAAQEVCGALSYPSINGDAKRVRGYIKTLKELE